MKDGTGGEEEGGKSKSKVGTRWVRQKMIKFSQINRILKGNFASLLCISSHDNLANNSIKLQPNSKSWRMR